MYGQARAAFIRVAIVAAAWSLGELLALLYAPGLDLVLAAILGAAAYVATSDMGSSGGGGGPAYWRGQRIDRSRWRR